MRSSRPPAWRTRIVRNWAITIQGRRLHGGDFDDAEPGSDHDMLSSETGCELLLVVAAGDNGL